jgi:cell division protein ZapA (FtsZ GTPase activity inhibitor)
MAINVFDPISQPKHLEVIADWCNQYEVNHYQLVDVATALALAELLEEGGKIDGERYRTETDMARKIGKLLGEVCSNDKQRLLGVTFLLKSYISSLQKGDPTP